MSDGVLAEQRDYCRARAGEYDEWWERRGRYDRGPDANERWFAEIAELRAAFDRLPLDGHVLELAAGTGYCTELLAHRARHVTVLDGAAEMLEPNRARLGRPCTKRRSPTGRPVRVGTRTAIRRADLLLLDQPRPRRTTARVPAHVPASTPRRRNDVLPRRAKHLIEIAGTAGFALDVAHTDTYFQYGIGTAR